VKWRDEGGVLLNGYEMFRTLISLKACKKRKQSYNSLIDLEADLKNNEIQDSRS
jgi:hypothetical protein